MRKYLEVTAFVALWMSLGWTLKLDVNAYLVLGVPLMLVFQWGVSRQPFARMWVADAKAFSPDAMSFVLGTLLAAYPAYKLIVDVLPAKDWGSIAWCACAVLGGVLGGFTLRRQTLPGFRAASPAFTAAVLAGVLAMMAGTTLRGQSVLPSNVLFFFDQLLLLFPALFMIEEVVFRGVLDSHLRGALSSEAKFADQFPSALFISMIWGVWHLPIAPSSLVGAQLIVVAVLYAIVHGVIGVPLSLAWRRGGTLALPALAHALIDAYRNATM